MAFSIGQLAALYPSGSSLHGQVAGLTLQEQINMCRAKEAEFRALAASEEPKKRKSYLHLAGRWANLAVAAEFEHYLRLR